MNILQIRLKNINSLKGEHTIDFRKKPLSEAGLFAITGPTGSGKTTVLDVITLALFSRIPRVSESVTKGFIERTGLVLTRNMDEALAEITYSCNEGVFTSQWSISKNRNGNLRDYEMQISDGSGAILPLKKSDVPARNEKLIGLNFDQFSKAIILAQGDFAAFLKAKKDERGKLLEKITGTWIYRELGKLAFQKNRELGQQLENLLAQANSRREQLMPAEDYRALLTAIEQSDTQIAACQVQIDQLKIQEKLKQDISDISNIISTEEEKLTRAIEEQTTFRAQNGERMERHARLLPYRNKLWSWKELQQKLMEQQNNLAATEKSLLGCKEEDKKLKEEVYSLTRSDAPPTEALELFRDKVLELQTRLGQAETLKNSALRSAKEGAGEIPLKLDLVDPDVASLHVEKEAAHVAVSLGLLTEQLPGGWLQEPATKMEELRKTADDLQLLLSETGSLEEKKLHLTKLREELAELQKELDEIPVKVAEATSSQKLCEMELTGLQKDRTIRDLTASLEEHRKKLVDGQPCPLCGALEHPYSDGTPPADDLLDKKIAEASAANEEWKKNITTLSSTLSIKQKSLEKTLKEETAKNAEVLQSEDKVNQIRARIPEGHHSDANPAGIEQLKEKIAALEKYRVLVEKGRKLKALSEKMQEYKAHFLSVAALSKELRELFPGNNVLVVTQNLMERFTGNNTLRERLLQEQVTLGQSHQETRDLSQSLAGELAGELPEYETLASALQHLMDDAEYTRLQTMAQQLIQEISNTDAGLGVHNTNLKTLMEKDSTTPLAEIQLLRQNKETENRENSNLRDKLKGQQVVQIKITSELEGLDSQIALQKKQNEKWLLLSRYIGDAEGKKFSTFAQELTLLQLVQKANKRLFQLNDRYMLGLPADEEDDSLVVLDTHMGEMRRSVKSLSGGETFLVSLSMALALSDLAAHKVEIKSLFIDEGFGSLDKLTLDQTMDTLEKLQYETSKTIGVISHVEAMQERITTQIRLEKGGQGHSTLAVI